MNWFNGHTTQFRCLVIHAGASNNESQYGVNDGGIGRELAHGRPGLGRQGAVDGSEPVPLRRQLEDAALITQGELDFRVPLNESITTFKLLQRQGVRARLRHVPRRGPLDPEGGEQPAGISPRSTRGCGSTSTTRCQREPPAVTASRSSLNVLLSSAGLS